MKADSLERTLNRKTYSAADATRMLLDGNPIYAQQQASVEISERDKFVQSTIYGEIIKNLEMNKTAQIQETPTVQIVDTPEIPLKDNRMLLIVSLITGAFFGAALCCIAIIVMPGSRKKKVITPIA